MVRRLLADPSEPLTEHRIKEIHSLVLMNDAQHKGIYRNVLVSENMNSKKTDHWADR